MLSICRDSLLWNVYSRHVAMIFSEYGRLNVSIHDDVTMGGMASQITSLTIVYSTVYSGADQRKHQSSASLALVRGIHRWTVNSPQKWPVTRKKVSIWWRHHAENGRLDVGASGCATNIELNTVNVLSEGHSAPTWVRVVGVTWCSSQHIMGIPLEGLFNIS